MANAPFCLVKEPCAWWPVRFGVPADGGTVAMQTIELKMARLSVSDFRAEWEGATNDAGNDRRLFERCVRDWRGVANDQGAAVPFADPWIGQLLDVPGFGTAFGAAYVAFWSAQAEAVAGNSAPSPAGGAAVAAADLTTTSAAPTSPPRSATGGRARKK